MIDKEFIQRIKIAIDQYEIKEIGIEEFTLLYFLNTIVEPRDLPYLLNGIRELYHILARNKVKAIIIIIIIISIITIIIIYLKG